MASWRTGPSPVFQHQLYSGHSRLPLNLSTQWRSEMLDESAQAPASLRLGIRPGLSSSKRRSRVKRLQDLPASCCWLLAGETLPS